MLTSVVSYGNYTLWLTPAQSDRQSNRPFPPAGRVDFSVLVGDLRCRKEHSETLHASQSR
jgi:hypothetical protein